MIPMACPACDRQYDVSHLDPGRSVRCSCDALFVVAHRAPRAIEALACGHCGGPVGTEDEACPFCSARLDEEQRESMLCPKCYTRVPDTARHCTACGVSIAPQALTPIPAGRDCLRCGAALRVRSLGERSAIECSACEGLWLARRVFDDACRDAVRSPLPASSRKRASGTPAETEGYVRCLVCDQPMLRQQFRRDRRMSGVVVDACRDHGIWLDRGELERVLSFLREERVGLHGLGSVGGAAGTSPADGGQAVRRLPTVVPPPERPHPVAEAVRYLAGLVGDFLG